MILSLSKRFETLTNPNTESNFHEQAFELCHIHSWNQSPQEFDIICCMQKASEPKNRGPTVWNELQMNMNTVLLGPTKDDDLVMTAALGFLM